MQIEHAVDLDENPPEDFRPCAIVRVMHGVFLERDGRRDFNRCRPDLDPEAGPLAHRNHRCVKISHRHRLERHGRGAGVGEYCGFRRSSMKSNSNAKDRMPSYSVRVVRPRGVTRIAEPHEWFSAGPCLTAIFPTTCVHIWSVA